MKSLQAKYFKSSLPLLIASVAISFMMFYSTGMGFVRNIEYYEYIIGELTKTITISSIIAFSLFASLCVFNIWSDEKNKRIEEFLLSTPLTKAQILMAKNKVLVLDILLMSISLYVDIVAFKLIVISNSTMQMDIVELLFDGKYLVYMALNFSIVFAVAMACTVIFGVVTDGKIAVAVNMLFYIFFINLMYFFSKDGAAVIDSEMKNKLLDLSTILSTIMIVLGIGILFAVAAYLLNRKYESSKCGKLIWYKPARIIIVLTMGTILGFQSLNIESVEKMSDITRFGLFTLCTVVVAIAVDKLLDRYDKE